MSYPIQQKFISKNRSGKVLNAKGTVLHETATPNASDEDEFKYFNSGAGGRSASAHAFVDFDSITQTVPWNEQAWHAGGTANRNYIGIELCNYSDRAKFEEIWKRGVWLFAWLHVNVINKTTISKDTLMSHAEVSDKWRETNHRDPIAYFAKFGKTVDEFRAAVQAEINSMIGQAEQVPTPSKVEVDTGTIGIVTATSLNVRNGAGTNYTIIGSLKNGTKVRIDRIEGNWYSIYFGDHGGFVYKDYIKLV